MSDWVRWADRKPKRAELCDFLFTGDDRSPNVWMMCSALRGEADEFMADSLIYWRPTAPLPEGVETLEDALDNRKPMPVDEALAANLEDDTEDDVELLIDLHHIRVSHDAETAPVEGCRMCALLHEAFITYRRPTS